MLFEEKSKDLILKVYFSICYLEITVYRVLC